MKEPYYLAYEKRYQAVFSAGAERWGHSPDDQVLYHTLKLWVEENHLQGKAVIEYACGEGACGVILSELGCIYHGVDIAPSAIEKSRELLKKYPNATVDILDMVKERVNGEFDAALDCMGFHMLVADSDREQYLNNVYHSLKDNAPMLFFRESYRREETYQGIVNTVDEWAEITGEDYQTPQLRPIRNGENGNIKEVSIPLLPARAKNKEQYIAEFEEAGFRIDHFVEMGASTAIPHSATIYVKKKSKQIKNG